VDHKIIYESKKLTRIILNFVEFIFLKLNRATIQLYIHKKGKDLITKSKFIYEKGTFPVQNKCDPLFYLDQQLEQLLFA
jgi:hypothetical protein